VPGRRSDNDGLNSGSPAAARVSAAYSVQNSMAAYSIRSPRRSEMTRAAYSGRCPNRVIIAS